MNRGYEVQLTCQRNIRLLDYGVGIPLCNGHCSECCVTGRLYTSSMRNFIMLSHPLQARTRGRLSVERLEDRLVPGEMLTGLLLAPMRLAPVAELVAAEQPGDPAPAAPVPADT